MTAMLAVSLSIIAIVMSAASLGWQVITWQKGGPVVDVTVSTSMPTYGDRVGDPHVTVTAMYTGRSPVTVNGWGLRCPDGQNMVMINNLAWSTPPAAPTGAGRRREVAHPYRGRQEAVRGARHQVPGSGRLREPGRRPDRGCGEARNQLDLTSEVAAWLENLQATDAKSAGLADDAIYALSRTGPAPGRPLAGTITASKIKNLKELRLVPAAPARSASCSSLARGVQRFSWSPMTSPASGTGGMPRRSRTPNSSMRST